MALNHYDPFHQIGPVLTLVIFFGLLLMLVGLLFCIGYCCCFRCYDKEGY